MAADNKATQDYLDLMEQYNPDGKVALLGVQGISSWLLFATAAAACGSELTADCLLEHAGAVKDWTGGGLHARQTPGNTVPSPCFLILGLDDDGLRLQRGGHRAHRRRRHLQLRRGQHLRAQRRLRRPAAGGLSGARRWRPWRTSSSNTVLGLSTAAIFALAASGLVLTYTTTGIFNFAHGAIGMLGAFTYWQLHVAWGWPIPLGTGRRAARGRARPRRASSSGSSCGACTTLPRRSGSWSRQPPRGAARPRPVGVEPAGGVPGPAPVPWQARRRWSDVNVTWHQLIAFVVAIAVAIGLRLLLYRTRIGLDMRATVDSRPLAMLHGARPDRSAAIAWAIGCSLAALAGILIGPLSGQLSHTNLTLLIVSAYAAAMIGRLRSLPMTFAGRGVPRARRLLRHRLPAPAATSTSSTFRFVIPVVVLFVVLLVLPNPQLRTRSVSASREEVPMPSWRTALCTAAVVIASAGVLAGLLSDADILRTTRVFGIALIALSLIPLTGSAARCPSAR